MLNIKACTPRTLRAVSVAAISAFAVAACATPSFAKHHHHNNPATTNTATEVTTSVSPGGAVQTTVSTASVPIDYRILADQDLDFWAIRRARAYGLTDSQIAQAAMLSHYGLVRMDRVLNQIEDGYTIADLASYYGVPLNDVMDTSSWEDRVRDYMEAYRTTGYGALRNGPQV